MDSGVVLGAVLVMTIILAIAHSMPAPAVSRP